MKILSKKRRLEWLGAIFTGHIIGLTVFVPMLTHWGFCRKLSAFDMGLLVGSGIITLVAILANLFVE